MVFPDLTLAENVMIGRQDRTRAGVLASILRTPGERAERRHPRTGDRAAVVRRAGRQGRRTGLQPALRRTAPAGHPRALATDPRILLLDEPAAGLNLQERIALRKLILKLHELGYTIVLIEHDIKLVMGLCEHIVVLEYGHKIADGTPQEVQRDEK